MHELPLEILLRRIADDQQIQVNLMVRGLRMSKQAIELF
jgi:hypothetical protein